jgi:hypothetical protein
MEYSGAVAGESRTALATKLGVKPATVLALVHAPPGIVVDLPAGVRVRNQARGHVDVAVAFFTRRSELERQIDTLGPMVFPAGGLWIAWPKKSSGTPTDITDHAVRHLALPRGMVDNKVCAIDQTWTGLRLVWRRERRSPAPS